MINQDTVSLCREERITVAFGAHRRTTIDGFVYGDFAVHRILWSNYLWTVSHLPTGSNVANEYGCFKTRNNAIEAMMEIQKLKKSWAVIVPADLTDDLKRKVAAICQKHGGQMSQKHGGRWYADSFRGYLNGYENI